MDQNDDLFPSTKLSLTIRPHDSQPTGLPPYERALRTRTLCIIGLCISVAVGFGNIAIGVYVLRWCSLGESNGGLGLPSTSASALSYNCDSAYLPGLIN
ncbi:MAG: hypothetical protein M1839_009373, partial [Geoglossum umbratile]